MDIGLLPAWTWLIGFWIGAVCGSFINMVAYRLPRRLSFTKPNRSMCPSCKELLGFSDLIPLFSWLTLKGKCRYCGARIGKRYFFTELVTATLFALIWHQQFEAGADVVKGVGYMLFAGALVTLIVTDILSYMIPDEVNAAMLFIGLGMNVATLGGGLPEAYLWGMPSSIAGALVGWFSIWVIGLLGLMLFRQDAMGHGDIKMMRGVGAVLLPAFTLLSVGIAVVLGAVAGAAIIVWRRKLDQRAEEEGEELEAREEATRESVGSYMWCGLGYLLCIDVIGLFVPKLYMWWFKEDPYAVEEIVENPRVQLTQLPFGPYLAAGALGAVLAGPVLMGWVQAYWRNAVGG